MPCPEVFIWSVVVTHHITNRPVSPSKGLTGEGRGSANGQAALWQLPDPMGMVSAFDSTLRGVLTFKNQKVSHKNVDFWLCLKNWEIGLFLAPPTPPTPVSGRLGPAGC